MYVHWQRASGLSISIRASVRFLDARVLREEETGRAVGKYADG
jgi:hypothetical protein